MKSVSGVFNGPQIDKLFENDVFASKLSPIEKNAFDAIKEVSTNFLGNKKAENYREKIAEMLDAFHRMNVNMSLKIHFLANHLDFFPENCGECSDEQGERFHQDIGSIETRFKGKDFRRLLGEYCWNICRDTTTPHKRQTTRPHF